MGAVAVFLEAAGGAVRSTSLPAIAAARELAKHHGGPVVGVVVGAGISALAESAARYTDRVMAFDHSGLAAPLAETWAPVLIRAIEKSGATALVASATSTAKDILPRAAALMGAAMATDIVGVTGAHTFRRPTYAGNALSDIELTTPVVFATVRQTDFPAATPAAASGGIEQGETAAVDPLGAEVLGIHETKSARPELTEAKVVVSGGRGMKSSENFKILEELTDLLGGALGASRAACDAGLVPNDIQVGQTGKVVAPTLYIGVAVSGAIQHLAGMKGSKVIVAINKDADAPIFQVADYGLVAGWETAIPALIAEIKKLKA